MYLRLSEEVLMVVYQVCVWFVYLHMGQAEHMQLVRV